MSNTLQDVIAWHEVQIAKARRKILEGEEWSAKHFDGQLDQAGTYYTEILPAEIGMHARCVRHWRLVARKIAALPPDQGTT